MTPRDNPLLVGHAAAEHALRAAFDAGRMHHAWLITGPEGIGKATLAFRFARALLADFPGPGLTVPPEHPVFRRVASGAHADLLAIARSFDEKRKVVRSEILVDDVRAVASFLALTAAEGGWRVVVVDGADHLNRNAANALLKLLEEPPPRTVLLLTAASPGRLLPTIRSRCRRLPLRPLAAEDFATVMRLAGHGDDIAAAPFVARASEGAPGRTIAWADAGLLPLLEQAAELSEGVPDRRRLAALAETAAAREGGLPCLVAALRSLIHHRARHDILEGAAAARHTGMCDDWAALGTLERETVAFNLDKRHATLGALELLQER